LVKNEDGNQFMKNTSNESGDWSLIIEKNIDPDFLTNPYLKPCIFTSQNFSISENL